MLSTTSCSREAKGPLFFSSVCNLLGIRCPQTRSGKLRPGDQYRELLYITIVDMSIDTARGCQECARGTLAPLAGSRSDDCGQGTDRHMICGPGAQDGYTGGFRPLRNSNATRYISVRDPLRVCHAQCNLFFLCRCCGIIHADLVFLSLLSTQLQPQIHRIILVIAD